MGLTVVNLLAPDDVKLWPPNRLLLILYLFQLMYPYHIIKPLESQVGSSAVFELEEFDMHDTIFDQ